MNSILEEHEDQSLSGVSFHSLNMMHSQEEDEITPPHDAIACDNQSTHSNSTNNLEEVIAESGTDVSDSIQTPSKNDYDDAYDGYPTDEHTIQSFAQPKQKELKRQTILQLARDRLAAKKKPSDSGTHPEAADDSSFLANVDVADVENKPDDSSFLVNADIEDAPDEFMSIGNMSSSDADSYYNVYASTMSRATASTRASTIGDQILKESNMAALMAKNGTPSDNQSTSTYSYRRAYVDNATLGSNSNFTSTCSALTDDYCYDARKTGMSEAIHANCIEENIKRTASGPVDADTGSMIPSSDESHEESLARPPLPQLSNYENPEHLTSVVAYEGEGYVDEEAARKYSHSERGGGCCGWFTASSRMIKLVVLFSIILMLVSVASVALALLLPKEQRVRTQSSASSSTIATEPNNQIEGEGGDGIIDNASSQNDVEALVPTKSPLYFPTYAPTDMPTSASPNPAGVTPCDVDVSCYVEGSRCTDGTTETCCGETFDSFRCNCVRDENGHLNYECFRFSKEACIAKTCNTSGPSTSAPSKAPEALVYSTSSITGSPTNKLSVAPTLVPSKRTAQPTYKPSNKPTAPPSEIPTKVPSHTPSEEPTASPSTSPTRRTTRTPSKQPTAPPSTTPTRRTTRTPSKQPTALPSKRPTTLPTKFPSDQPTLPPSTRPTQLPTRVPSDQPIVAPSKTPTDKPTTVRPTPLPTDSPIRITETPTATPILSPLSNAPTRTTTLTQTLTLKAVADTYVDERSANFNYGRERILRVDGSPRAWSFVAFDMTSIMKNIQAERHGRAIHQHEPRKLQSVEVVQAKLRLYSLDEGGGGIFFALPNAEQWSEIGLTWNRMDEVDRTGEFWLGSVGWVKAFEWFEMDVADVFTENQSVNALTTFLIKSASTNGVTFASRERNSGFFSPELILTVASDSALSTNAPISNSPINARLPTYTPTRWPTYPPTRYDLANSPMQASQLPSNSPYENSLTPSLTKSNQSPTKSPSPTDTSDFLFVKNSVPSPSSYPLNYQTNPAVPGFVPPGCPVTSDINLAFKEALPPEKISTDTHIVFPSQESDTPSSTSTLEFDLGFIASTNSIHKIVSVSLRLFINSVGDSNASMSIHRDVQPFNGDLITFHVTPSDEGGWMTIDITDLIETDIQADNKIALVMKDISEGGNAGNFEFASRETCHSSKLVMVTE
eukprot:CAMPEP_0183715350 /NCGR_PEP_ID=MMETSP0737-20130205/9608_1 /TAXON_ID=385413 /ORGANISM="Thalassiosira miniscula, Strain CCMP1093" /LENGTH=1182 /DNA_ID=CAMNT_0025944441 /DNA_START=211 /DNA_END=3759 /DNA_ORIENTATION=+